MISGCPDAPISGAEPGREFQRDRFTWLAYVLLAWFAYLQAAPGLVLAHLRDELGLTYSIGGLYVAAFAAGSIVAGVMSAWLERVIGRRGQLWSATVVMAAGMIGLTAGHVAAVTIGSVLVMGLGGGLLLVTIQAALADHHGERRTVALAEANLAASIAYITLVGVLSLTAAVHLGWRIALLVSLAIPVLAWRRNRHVPIVAPPPPPPQAHATLPGVFYIAAAMLVCTSAAEWCITAWGVSFVEDAANVSANTAVTLMAAYFAGVIAGRTAGSRLARRYDPARLLAIALALTAAGFAVLWPSTTPAQALIGLSLLGIGLGNLFPMGMSLALTLAPTQAVRASGRAVAISSFAVLVAPLTVGTLADATSLKAALGLVPVTLILAAVALTLVSRTSTQSTSAPAITDRAHGLDETRHSPEESGSG